MITIEVFSAVTMLALAAGAEPEQTRVVPINTAEAIFAPFWDPKLEELARWDVAPGDAPGAVKQAWSWVELQWKKKGPAGLAVRLSRNLRVDCRGYDRLLTALMLPPGCRLKIGFQTSGGESFSQEWLVASPIKQEYEMDLKGAREIRGLTLEVFDRPDDEPRVGWLTWLGLRNSQKIQAVRDQWRQFAQQPIDAFLAPPETEPSFEPRFGLLGDAAELRAVREKYRSVKAATGQDPFDVRLNLRKYREKRPQEYLSFYSDTIGFGRPGDYEGSENLNLVAVASAAFITKDKEILRTAAAGAVRMGLCPNWDAGFMMFFPGSAWNQRPFEQAMISYKVAVCLDLAWDFFSPAGRAMLLRRLAVDGVGFINYNVWEQPYIFGCNQLSVFSQGRIAAYTIFEKQWSHVAPYNDLAYRELCESVDRIILPDGGFPEGSGYLGYTMTGLAPALKAYATARGKRLRELIPERLRRAGAYADVLASTDRHGGLIPFADSSGSGRGVNELSLAFLAYCCPESQWVSLFRQALATEKGHMPYFDLLAWSLEREVPPAAPAPPPFTELADMGVISSVRRLEGEPVKLVLFGNRPGAGHQHEDKGSFVLEFAGDTYAMDPGGGNYYAAGAGETKFCQRHNMLVPVGTPQRPGPENPCPHTVRPRGTGTTRTLSAEIDAGQCWKKYYRKWLRRIDSPAPDRFVIRDEYVLLQGTGVEFVWMTQLPVRRSASGRNLILQGQGGQAILTPPPDAIVSIDELPLRGEKMTRIHLMRPGLKGTLEVVVQLQPVNGISSRTTGKIE